eukprot:CAMPEP_0115394964 /NCGR_PEP_ID=MMETSP0271-20121206/12540_1 /TAXON_ID=71861 /ORGANISM="Scrippsiella trochoidea, Strain CCMP3099" /LENGTH=445 /DNA_ID=CAMNT_0002818657 /DNA_START=62 /DNA_END=1399 /DNA_ORIENTATION=-
MQKVVVKGTFINVEEGCCADDLEGEDGRQRPALRSQTTSDLGKFTDDGSPLDGAQAEYVNDGSSWTKTGNLAVDRRDRRVPSMIAEEDDGDLQVCRARTAGSDKADASRGGDDADVNPSGETGGDPQEPVKLPLPAKQDRERRARKPKKQGSRESTSSVSPMMYGMTPENAMGFPMPPNPFLQGMPPPFMPPPQWAYAAAVAAAAGYPGMPAGVPPPAGMPASMPAGMSASMPAGMPAPWQAPHLYPPFGGFMPPMPPAPEHQPSPNARRQRRQKAKEPGGADAAGGDVGAGEDDQTRTTLMLRNIPNNYTRAMLKELLDSEGFMCRYDFLYLPHDFKTQAGLGFAFVNLITHEDAERMRQHLTGFRRWAIPSSKTCAVGWSGPDQQGLAANIERYRNSSVMHKSVPEECKPLLLENGIPMKFPPATRKLWPPHENYGVRANRGY